MLLTSLFVLFALAAASAQSDFCPDEHTLNDLTANIVKKDFTSLVANKIFIDIWRRKDYVEKMSCSMTKFTLDDSGHLKVVIHNVRNDGREYKYRDVWAENKETGKVFIAGAMDGYEVYTEYLYLLYVDENVYAYWACHPQSYQQDKHWRVAISVVKGKRMDDPEVQASLGAATKKLKELEHVTGEMALMSQTRCPNDFPVEEIVPQTTTTLIP